MKNKKLISLLCPTLARPEGQKRLARSVYNTCNFKEKCEIVFGIDNNDKLAKDTVYQLKEELNNDFINYVEVEPGKKLAQIINTCANNAASNYILGCVADDCIFESNNWDIFVLRQFSRYADGILLLWPDDGIWGGSLASHYFISRKWQQVIGHVQPEYFYADWTDHWMQRLAEYVGRTCRVREREKLFIRHMHVEHSDAPEDSTHWKVKERRERNVKEGLNFGVGTTPLWLQQAHEQEKQKLVNYIKQFNNDK